MKTQSIPWNDGSVVAVSYIAYTVAIITVLVVALAAIVVSL